MATQLAPRRISKKEKTRDALMSAMQLLILEKGYDDISIRDITTQADVAFGTFYNYFQSKKEIMEAVSSLLAHQYSFDVDQLIQSIADPAETFAASMIFTFHRMVDGNYLGNFLFDSGIALDHYMAIIGVRGVTDIERAINAGRFHVENRSLIFTMISGSTFATAHGLFQGNLPVTAIPEMTKVILTMLGMKEEEAREIAFKQYNLPIAHEFPLSQIRLREQLGEQSMIF